MLSIPQIIQKKRNGEELTAEEIQFFTDSLSGKEKPISDSQIGAMLMAMYLNGLNDREIKDLTFCMTHSGDILQYKKSKLVDKHSTGGVGDKISLILAPALAGCGFRVPMVSGRGLAHTGGTLDKLESIPNYKVELTFDEMTSCLDKVGCFIGGATASLAPADKILYQHRDVTATVDSLPLITSSILSKKAAEGISTLVMDLTVGCGSLFKNLEEAERLANIMVGVAAGLGITMRAVFSDMNSPRGRCVGNALEVAEAVKCLRNEGNDVADVIDLVKTLGGVILLTEGQAQNLEDAKSRIEDTLHNGSALKIFKNMLIEQGVTEKHAQELCFGDVWNVLPRSNHVTKLTTSKTGFIADINALDIGNSCLHLGAGRTKPGASIDYSVGVKLLKIIGDKVEQNESWVEVHHKDEKLGREIEELIQRSLVVQEGQVEKKSRIIKIL